MVEAEGGIITYQKYCKNEEKRSSQNENEPVPDQLPEF